MKNEFHVRTKRQGKTFPCLSISSLHFSLYCATGLFCLLIISHGQPAEGAPPHSARLSNTSILENDSRHANPKVAIIIDDLGLNLSIANALLDLEIPLSFSILPGLAYSEEIARRAHFSNRDVLFHIPMEPQKYPEIDPGPYSLLSSMGPKTLEKTLKEGLASIPYVIGANNHMGSKLTEDKWAMRLVLGHLKKLGLFFIDSRTSSRSKAFQVARKMGLRTAKRNVFLDSERNRDFIVKQFRKLKISALSKGSSIGIGHPNRITLSVLKEVIPRFRESGIRFVSVSELVY